MQSTVDDSDRTIVEELVIGTPVVLFVSVVGTGELEEFEPLGVLAVAFALADVFGAAVELVVFNRLLSAITIPL